MSRFTDILDLATASAIVLGTMAFFAFVYFLPEAKPKPPGQAEEQAEEAPSRTRPSLSAPSRAALNISRTEAPAAPPQEAPQVPPQPVPLGDPALERFEDRSRAAQGHWDQGIVAYQKGDFAQARKEWTLCLELKPDHSDCRAGSRRLDANGVAPSPPAPGRRLGPSEVVLEKKDAREFRRLVVFFEKGKAAVDARAGSVLDTTAQLLELYPLTRLRVVAFADREEIDPDSLAKRRAEEVRSALLSRRLSPERVVCQVQIAEQAAFRAELHIER